MYPEKAVWVWNGININWESQGFTLKACAKVAAATNGDVFARLVVIFLKRTL